MTNAAAKTPAKILATCDKCEGKGSIYGFSHYAAGVCFDCSGNGTRYVTAHEAKISAEMTAAAEKADTQEKVIRAFVEAHLHLTTAQVVAKLGAVSFEKIHNLHGFVAGYVTNGLDDARPMLRALNTLLERFVIEDLRAA
jgi:hypothetical protein